MPAGKQALVTGLYYLQSHGLASHLEGIATAAPVVHKGCMNKVWAPVMGLEYVIHWVATVESRGDLERSYWWSYPPRPGHRGSPDRPLLTLVVSIVCAIVLL